MIVLGRARETCRGAEIGEASYRVVVAKCCMRFWLLRKVWEGAIGGPFLRKVLFSDNLFLLTITPCVNVLAACRFSWGMYC